MFISQYTIVVELNSVIKELMFLKKENGDNIPRIYSQYFRENKNENFQSFFIHSFISL